MNGLSSGSVMENSCCLRLAPSIRADSYRSIGILCRPDRKMIALYPVQRHITIVEIAILTPHQPELKATFSSPRPFSIQLIIPLLPNKVLNTSVTATMDVIFGMK
ncbi:hypothetical protein D3C80_1802130 [compost metagenome]